jgi:3-methyladenine DNA glycosylase AlkD
MKTMIDEILAELEELGTEQNINIYKNHGAKGKVYGVSIGNLDKLASKIKREYDNEHPEFYHTEIRKLWDSGVLDARALSVRLVYPELMKKTVIQKWVNDINYYHLANQFVTELVLKTDYADEMAKKWMTSKHEYILRCSFDIIRFGLPKNKEFIDKEFIAQSLKYISLNITSSPNRAKESMNLALIAIGKNRPEFLEITLAIAKNIGKIKINQGDTSCRDFDAYEELYKFKEK